MKAKSGDPDQRPHSMAIDLGLYCFPTCMSHKEDARHIWFKNAIILLSDKSSRNLGSILLK